MELTVSKTNMTVNNRPTLFMGDSSPPREISLYTNTGVVSAEMSVKVNLKRKVCSSPVLTVSLESIKEYAELNIVGDLRVYKNKGIIHTSSGQNHQDLIKYFGKNVLIQRLADIWARWNLNSCRYGTFIQNEYVTKKLGSNFHLSSAIAELNKANLSEESGIKYGETWLVEIIPPNIITELLDICQKLS